jgi:hypothetical protein
MKARSATWALVIAGILGVGFAPDSARAEVDDGIWSIAVDENEPAITTSASVPWAVRDSHRDRMILLLRDSGFSRVMTLKLDTGVWNIIASGPPIEAGSNAVYDRGGDRVVVFGGRRGSTVTNETWALPLGTPEWVQLFPSGTPPSARENHSASFDPFQDRMIVAGGSGAPNEVWSLSLGESPAWTQITPSGTPPNRIGKTAVFDELGRRLIYATYESTVLLTLGDDPSWSSAPGTGGVFVPRTYFDGARHRLIAVEDANANMGPHYWAFDLESLQWDELEPTGDEPPVLANNRALAAVFDHLRHRLVQFGMISCTGGTGSCFAWNGSNYWTFDAPAVAVDPIAPALAHSALVSVDPSPAFGPQTFVYRIAAGDAPRALEIYSVDGRRVWSATLAAGVAGSQTSSWDGRTLEHHRAQAGVYFARLITARGASTRRFVRL